MLLPLVYYLVAFFVYILLYEYYRNNIRKITIAQLDFFQILKVLPLIHSVTSIKSNLLINMKTIKKLFFIFIRTFDQIKTEICSYFYFNRIRIVFGIDLSASNEWQGRKTFQGQSLHKTQGNKIYNPYQKVRTKN